jgi:hypothetical protein
MWQKHNAQLVNFDVTSLRLSGFVRARFWVAYYGSISS